MKIKKSQLKRLINEELYKALSEVEDKYWDSEGNPMIPNPDTGGWQQDPNLSSRTEEADLETLQAALDDNIYKKRYVDKDNRVDPRLNALARWRRIEKALPDRAQEVYVDGVNDWRRGMDLYRDDDGWLRNVAPRPRPEMTFTDLANKLGISSAIPVTWPGQEFKGNHPYTQRPLKYQGIDLEQSERRNNQ